MNILLLSPEFPDTFWSFKHALKFIHRRASSPPLGLLTVAALLPREWNKRLVDLNVTTLSDDDLAWADYAFIGGMIVQRDSARRLIDRCKNAGLPIVAGGPLFTVEHEQFPDVDHFVLNEAEVTLPPFLADLERGCAKRVYASTEYADLHTTPMPLWELADLRRYASMTVQFCRGCPYDCDFCNVTALLGHRPRTKTTTQMIAELDRLCELGWRGPVEAHPVHRATATPSPRSAARSRSSSAAASSPPWSACCRPPPARGSTTAWRAKAACSAK